MYLLEIIIGLMMLFNPVGLTSGIVITLGIALLILGLIQVQRYFKEPASQGQEKLRLFHGLVLLLAGVLLLVKTDEIISSFPYVSLIYGISVIVNGLLRLQMGVDAIRAKKSWKFHIIYAAATLILGTLVMINPFNSLKALSRVVGGTLLLVGIIDPSYEIWCAKHDQ
jgi:uncharacterized membrane protein HdeD (DUF308 family)